MVFNPNTGRGISEVTLRLKFRAELDRGLVQTKMRVGTSLVRMALGTPPTEHHAGIPGNVTAAIFYLKTKAGWKEDAPPADTSTDEDVNLEDAGRRIAFALAAAERQGRAALPAPAVAPKTKAKAREEA